MTATQINSENKSIHKRQKFSNQYIGPPLAPARSYPQKKQEREVLSDWYHAS
jgi:hypothetical protein